MHLFVFLDASQFMTSPAERGSRAICIQACYRSIAAFTDRHHRSSRRISLLQQSRHGWHHGSLLLGWLSDCLFRNAFWLRRLRDLTGGGFFCFLCSWYLFRRLVVGGLGWGRGRRLLCPPRPGVRGRRALIAAVGYLFHDALGLGRGEDLVGGSDEGAELASCYHPVSACVRRNGQSRFTRRGLQRLWWTREESLVDESVFVVYSGCGCVGVCIASGIRVGNDILHGMIGFVFRRARVSRPDAMRGLSTRNTLIQRDRCVAGSRAHPQERVVFVGLERGCELFCGRIIDIHGNTDAAARRAPQAHVCRSVSVSTADRRHRVSLARFKCCHGFCLRRSWR